MRCYQIASPRVQQYLRAEIAYALERVRTRDRVIELGCGYGRVLGPISDLAREVVGIDNAIESLRFAQSYLGHRPGIELVCSDAVNLPFPSGSFDVTLCLQNGISAFKVDPVRLMREGLRVTRRGGYALFSSYAAGFWMERLEWFRTQAADGLVGPIDEAKSGDGTIVCKDGFIATTVAPEEFSRLAAGHDAEVKIEEVDGSSLFCVLRTR